MVLTKRSWLTIFRALSDLFNQLHHLSCFMCLYTLSFVTQGQTGDNPEIRALTCSAMTALHVRPVLFQYVLTEFATARRTCVVRGFIQALTRGGPGMILVRRFHILWSIFFGRTIGCQGDFFHPHL